MEYLFCQKKMDRIKNKEENRRKLKKIDRNNKGQKKKQLYAIENEETGQFNN